MSTVNKRKSLLALTLATTLSLTGFKSKAINYDNNESDITTQQTTNYNYDNNTTKEELQKLLEQEYYNYFESYEVKYLHPEYLTSDEELENFQKMVDSYQECTYTCDSSVEEMMEIISQNTERYIIEHPNSNYINATNCDYAVNISLEDPSFFNYLQFLISSEMTLESFIEKLINNEFSNNTNEDLCKMQDLVMVLDTTTVPDTDLGVYTLAEYNQKENSIIIYLNSFLIQYNLETDSYITYDINTPNSIPYEQFELLEKSVAHELNHMREVACNDRIENGQMNLEISYDDKVSTSLIESTAESAIFDEKNAIYGYENSYSNSSIYYSEREFENELLLLSLTDNSTTIDDYYSSIFDSDWNSLIKFFNLKSANDIKTFLNILKSSDAIFLRNDIAFDIENIGENEKLSRAEAKISLGTNYRIDILRLALKNLIDYNMNSKEKLTAEEMITLEKIMIYQMFDNGYVLKLDESGEFITDNNQKLVSFYEPSFTEQAYDLEKKFYEYIIQTYNISSDELTKLEELATTNIDDMNYNMRVYYVSNMFYYENSVANSLVEKFPKLKNIIPGLNYASDYNYNKALVRSNT